MRDGGFEVFEGKDVLRSESRLDLVADELEVDVGDLASFDGVGIVVDEGVGALGRDVWRDGGGFVALEREADVEALVWREGWTVV